MTPRQREWAKAYRAIWDANENRWADWMGLPRPKYPGLPQLFYADMLIPCPPDELKPEPRAGLLRTLEFLRRGPQTRSRSGGQYESGGRAEYADDRGHLSAR